MSQTRAAANGIPHVDELQGTRASNIDRNKFTQLTSSCGEDVAKCRVDVGDLECDVPITATVRDRPALSERLGVFKDLERWSIGTMSGQP